MRDYGSSSFWDERYAAQDNSSFDWYQDFSTLEPLLMPFLSTRPSFEILIAGCGNSRLGPELHDKGFCNLTCIDTSTVVINQMSDRYADKEDMEFTVMDVKNMEIPDACFDLIIDKALFDATLCTEDNITNISQMLSEINRTLKPGGTYLMVSHGEPSTRLAYLETKDAPWRVEVQEIAKPPTGTDEEDAPKYHYLYCCRKLAAASGMQHAPPMSEVLH